MTGSRTVKVLVVLVLAMTLGTIALRLMETKPSPLSMTDLMATTPPFGSEFQTDVPLKASTWRHIVIHSTGAEGSDVLRRAHFVIDADGPQPVRPTGLWKMQQAARHVVSSAHDYNADSISVCLVGDFSRRPPTARQFQELVRLVRSLQQACEIGPDKVYTYRPDLGPGRYSPGEAFPAREFAANLLAKP